jgi:hypothetical protein
MQGFVESEWVWKNVDPACPLQHYSLEKKGSGCKYLTANLRDNFGLPEHNQRLKMEITLKWVGLGSFTHLAQESILPADSGRPTD